jgi:hypothetical protein
MRKGGVHPLVGIGACLLTALLFQHARAQVVTITLEGEIPPSCEVTAPNTYVNLGDLSQLGQARIPFQVRCNTPFRFELISQNGALTASHEGSLRPGFTATVPYEVAVQIPTSGGDITGQCTSAALRSAGCNVSDGQHGLALEGDALLTLSWKPHLVPIASNYSDVLTLFVGPKI